MRKTSREREREREREIKEKIKGTKDVEATATEFRLEPRPFNCRGETLIRAGRPAVRPVGSNSFCFTFFGSSLAEAPLAAIALHSDSV